MPETPIIDTPWSTLAIAQGLRGHGIDTVIRYYNFANSRVLPEKALTLPEAQTLSAAGLTLVTVFQQRQTRVDDFSGEQGRRAGRRAFELARQVIGQPPESAIYFAVDFDASEAEVAEAVIPYFRGVKEAFDRERGSEPGYLTGCYGSGLVARRLSEEGLVDCVWLSMSRGFRETRDMLDSGNWHLNQLWPPASVLGLAVDFNERNPDGRSIGEFTVADEDGAVHRPLHLMSGPATAVTHRVVARAGLRLRSGPGTQFDIIGGMQLGTQVHVAGWRDGWAKVDRDGDGAIDGFAFGDFLEAM